MEPQVFIFLYCQLFRPEEIELLVCGSPLVDLGELQKVTVYDGYTSQDVTVRLFWEIIESFSLEQQKSLLMFVTGSDRIPVGGAMELNFKVSKLSFSSESKSEM